MPDYIPLPYQYPDTVGFVKNGGVLSYHHNTKAPLFDFQTNEQGLEDPGSYFNPMRNNTFGVYMYSPQLKPAGTTNGTYLVTNYTSFNLVSSQSSNTYKLYVGISQEQTTNVNSWKNALI